MKWLEVKIVFDARERHLASEIISNILFESELKGVVEEDPDLAPAEDWGENSIGPPLQHAVVGYMPKDRRAHIRCRALKDRLAPLKEDLALRWQLICKEIDEEDWAESWKTFFKPQKIGRKIVVKPTWCEYRAAAGDIVLELDPGMAFGTGTHPTTALCIHLIEDYLKEGDRFLDVGTGSGILMIAAIKLGAGFVCGIDKDSLATEVAAANLQLNATDPRKFSLRTGNLLSGIEEKYDFIAANLFTHVILELLDHLHRTLAEGGIFVCSGIFDKNKNLVIAAMKNMGFEILETRRKEEWAAVAGRLYK
jgi:ribosomal protein L11 methyltransferase